MRKTDLVEIKKGSVGRGLLIENDGYISMNEGNNKRLVEDFNRAEEWYCPYPFIVSAVFQKYGIQNANGRIYPEEVLRKQVELYQQKIKEKRALGECYTPDVLVLTEKGWKTLADIKEGENILTLNTETQEVEINPVLRKIEKDFDGEMIQIKGRNIDDLVTPQHKFPLFSSRDNKYVGSYTAEDMMEGRVHDLRHKYIKKTANWVGRNDEYFIIPKLDESITDSMKESARKKYSEDLIIPMKSFARFMGIYLSEGYCDKQEDGSRVFICQKKQNVCEEIKTMLDEWGIHYTIEFREDNQAYNFFIGDMRLCKYVQQFGLCYDKFVPFDLKQQNKETLEEFYKWFVLGDGRIRGDKRRGGKHLTDDVFSTSERLVLDLNEIQMKIGYNGHYHMEKRDNDRYFGDRLIEGKNCQPMHFSLKSKTKGVHLDERFIHFSKVPYKGQVMCLEVENHTFFVMSNGKSHWTNNCNHPAESTIDLGRVSHNIIELHWEGRTLVGEMELNLSQGFVKQGICSTLGDTVANLLLNGYKIGVSSRGVGSVEQRLGKMIVGEDFELICWDCVSDPSTPSAWIGQSEEELLPYLEDKKVEGSVISEKINKIKELL